MLKTTYHQDSYAGTFAHEVHAHLNKMVAESVIETGAREIRVTPMALVVLVSGNGGSEVAHQLDTSGGDADTGLVGFLDGTAVYIDDTWSRAEGSDVEGLATLIEHNAPVGEITVRGIHFV